MTLLDLLDQKHVLKRVVIPAGVDVLLRAFEPDGALAEAGAITTGAVKLVGDLGSSPIPGFDFGLTLPTGIVNPAPFKLFIDPVGAPDSFKLWINLAEQGQLRLGFQLIDAIPGLAMSVATRVLGAGGTETLQPVAGAKPILAPHTSDPGAALGPALQIRGSATEPASIHVTPDTLTDDGVIELAFKSSLDGPGQQGMNFDPVPVVFGSSGIGFFSSGIVLDDSGTLAASGHGAPGLVPPLAAIPADTPVWRGILSRELDFFLPASVPFVGGRPIRGYAAIANGAAPELVVETSVPAGVDGAPPPFGYGVRIECRDPSARGLAGLLPTLIQATVDFPLDPQVSLPGGGALPVESHKPLRIVVSLARDPVQAADAFTLTVAATSAGSEGLVAVRSKAGEPIPKSFNMAAALVTSLMANDALGSAHGSATAVLGAVAAAGAAVSSLFKDESSFVLHGVELSSSGQGIPLGDTVAVSLDYTVAARVKKLSIPGGALSIEMRDDQPMRIRVHRVTLSYGPGGFDLDTSRAEMELEDPGAWDLSGLGPLFDVLGSRSGRGSTWIEVDLRFKLNLGPIRVSGATVRATLNPGDLVPDVSLRGLDASLELPGVVSGHGAMQMIDGGFAAELDASILPLNLTADAMLVSRAPQILVALGVDLPAPIPIANSGLGLFGVEGLAGFSTEPDYSAVSSTDPVMRQLYWDPKNPASYKPRSGESTFGFGAVIGTLPDMGFSFSSKASLLVSVPDVQVRGALNGKILSPVTKISDPTVPNNPGVSFLGFVGVDSTAVSFAVMGKVDLRPLLDISIPVAGHFPITGQTDDWYVYLGADGYAGQGRSIGPISASVLPDLIGLRADAYVMFRGRGIESWPNNRSGPGFPMTVAEGFVIAFGFGMQSSFGARPIAWADLYASLDLLLGTNPVTLAGFGRAGGGLHLGPFSLGVDAKVSFLAQRGASYLWAEVTGRIELLFITISGTVTITFGDLPTPTLPKPDRHPLDVLDSGGRVVGSTAVLTDDTYRTLARLVEDPAQLRPEDRVWPDAMISIPFGIGPTVSSTATAQFANADGPGAIPPQTVGTEMLTYQWHLDTVSLVDVTDEEDQWTGPGTAPPGKLTSRWQTSRGDGTYLPELVLFSNSGDLWVNRLADGGVGQPHPPLQQGASPCTTRVSAVPGWAVGGKASRATPGLRLPPDPVSLDPLHSRVAATLRHGGVPDVNAWEVLDERLVLPAGYSLEPASIRPWPSPAAIERVFDAHLVAPNLRFMGGVALYEDGPYRAQQADLQPETPIVDGLLILVVDERWINAERIPYSVAVRDEHAVWKRDPEPVTLPTGETAWAFMSQTSKAITAISVSWPLGVELGIVGLRGTTTTSLAAAQGENDAWQQIAAQLAQAAADGPKTDPATNDAGKRVILDPGRTYRLDFGFSWDGHLWQQDENGQRVEVKDQAVTNGTTYDPAGGAPGRSTVRSLFFATAPHQAAPAPKPGDQKALHWKRRRQQEFHPDMLARYLGGYSPAQSEPFFFCDDPLRAHFTQDHVAALAKAYGYDLLTAVRGVDQPGPAFANPLLLPPTWTFATHKAYLNPIDQVRYDLALASSCAVPFPGATASVLTPLEPERWYEVYIRAKASGGDPDGTLPGITFRTSRWRSPEQMLTALGFSDPAAPALPTGVVNGDLEIPTVTLPGGGSIAGDDIAFQQALSALGLDGWPIATKPRASRLWTRAASGGWLFAGIMLESPEPIHRPGRLELDPNGPTLAMGASGAGVRFGAIRTDRSGSRLLYLTSTPFAVRTWEYTATPKWPFLKHLRPRTGKGIGLNINLNEGPPGIWPGGGSLVVPITPALVFTATSMLTDREAGTPIVRAIAIPAAPDFAEDDA